MKIKTKQSQTDFQVNQLPHNRVQVFWDVLKLHWRTFLILDLVLFVGILPLLAVLFFRDNYALGLAAKVAEGTMSAEDRLATLKYAHLIESALDKAGNPIDFDFSLVAAGQIVKVSAK